MRYIPLNGDEIKRLYVEEGLTCQEISEIFGVCSETILHRLIEANIPRRMTGRRPQKQHPLSNIQQKYLYGALLGDDCLKWRGKQSNAMLHIVHSNKQAKYVQWKFDLWKNLVIRTAPKLSKVMGGFNGEHYSMSFYTVAHKELTEFYHLFYENGKKRLTKSTLEKTFESPFSLAVWYMDDGSFAKKRERVALHTEGFSYDENILIKKLFKNLLSIDVNVYPNRARGLFFIHMNKPNAKQFLKIVEPHIIESMRYKVGTFDDILEASLWRRKQIETTAHT